MRIRESFVMKLANYETMNTKLIITKTYIKHYGTLWNRIHF